MFTGCISLHSIPVSAPDNGFQKSMTVCGTHHKARLVRALWFLVDAWLAERARAGNLEVNAFIQRVSLMIEHYGESRFTRWDNVAAKLDEHALPTSNRPGFRCTMNHCNG